VDATGCAGHAQPAPCCAAWCPAATALPGLPGLLVTAVTQTDDGWTAVDVLTASEHAQAARYCPDCGVRAAVKETVTTTPRDVYLGDRQVLLRWRKRRWEYPNRDCQRKTFTESLPAVPPRARLTSRLRTRLGQAVGDDLMPAATAARRYGVSDRTAARAFTAYADTQLADLDEQ
jgi:transposase